ncbi:MAG: hypothetical protein OIF50_07755 [Flavobacteriaceae bacterium]|nr:hypothetical protein [Flavobacteriaceae bacterium]
MKRFIFSILFCWLIIVVNAQTREIAQKSKSIDARGMAELDLDLRNISLVVAHSKDQRVHMEYKGVFNNYSQKETKAKMDQLQFEFQKKGNQLRLRAKVSDHWQRVLMDRDFMILKDSASVAQRRAANIFHRGFAHKKPLAKPNQIYDKSKVRRQDSTIGIWRMLEQYNTSLTDSSMQNIKRPKVSLQQMQLEIERHYQHIDLMPSRFRQYDTAVRQKMKPHAKFSKLVLYLRIPKSLSLKVFGVHIDMYIPEEMEQEIRFKGEFSSIYAQSLKHPKNHIELDYGELYTHSLQGKLRLNSVQTTIGKLQEAKIRSVSSSFSIGETHKGIEWEDFNSILSIYEVSRDFGKMKLIGHYSKLHFYDSQWEYAIKAFGNHCKVYSELGAIQLGDQERDRDYLMFHKKRKHKKPYAGLIDLHIKNSLVYMN